MRFDCVGASPVKTARVPFRHSSIKIDNFTDALDDEALPELKWLLLELLLRHYLKKIINIKLLLFFYYYYYYYIFYLLLLFEKYYYNMLCEKI